MRGGQRQVLLLTKALKDAGHTVTLLARKDSPLWLAGQDVGLPLDAANAQMIWRHAKTVDLVHAHDARAHALVAFTVAKPFVVSRRVAFAVKRSPLSHWKYVRPARFLAVSQFVAKQLQAANIPSEKIDVVYDAVDEAVPAAEWNLESPAVALANADPGKGRDLVERAAQLSGLNVIFSDDLGRDLSTSSMFVYISRSEGLGSAVLLAMQIGIPVIASDVGGLREVVTHNETGILVRNEPAEIAQAMRRLCSDQAAARSLIDRARARVHTEFSISRLLEQTLASYRRAGAR